MTKHRKHKTNKRSQRRRQRGGGFFDLFTGAKTDYSAQASAYATEATTGLTSWFNSAKKTVTEATGATDTYTAPVTTDTYTAPPTTSQYNPVETEGPPPTQLREGQIRGGRKHKKSLKGGKGGLGLAYYATPVSGLKVVEPNEWLFYNNMANLKGGSRKRKRKTRRRKTRRRKTRRRKTRK